MCGPGGASLAIQGIGAVGGAAGAMFSASAEKLGYKMDAFIARQNAAIASDNARFAMQKGNAAETRQRLETAQIKSNQRATFAAGNVDLETGSPLARLATTDYLGEADANTIRLNAVREAMGYRNEASSQRMKAIMAKGAAKGVNPFLAGVTSLLGSASSVASNWYRLKSAGALGSSPQASANFFSMPSGGG